MAIEYSVLIAANKGKVQAETFLRDPEIRKNGIPYIT